MASKDERKLARTIVDLSRRLDASRARQLPFTSVELDDGTEQGVTDGIGVGRDAYDLTTTHDESISDISDISDSSAIEATFLPELLASGHGSSDAAFELGLATAARVTEARDIADEALEKAIAAGQTATGFRRVRSAEEPEAPEGGWERNDEWVRVHPDTHPDLDLRGKAYEVLVWNGTEFAHAEYLADTILLPSDDGTIRLGKGVVYAPNMAADALDAMTVRSPQIYGGYIEAPTIASSSKLGGGANRLNDPFFEGAINSSWVASGHMGDAAVKQTDTVTWSQPWNWYYNNSSTPTSRRVNSGRVTADLNLKPRPRRTGSITFANYSWFDSAARNIDNPYTFKAIYGTSIITQLGGVFDPTFDAIDFPPLKVATARTTYLTNSAVVPVASGDIWNLRLGAARLTPEEAAIITVAEIQVVNATTGALLWTHSLSREALIAGEVNAFWNCQFTGNVKYRIRATYTAAGESLSRTYSPSSWANATDDGALDDQWSGAQSKSAVYGGHPQEREGLLYMEGNPLGPGFVRRARFDWKLQSAIFSKVEGGRGWRLSEEAGLELFSSMGAKTAQLDGENNFFAGRIASAETGARWEVVRDKMSLFDGTNTEVANIRRDGIYMRFGGSIRADGDTGWSRIDSGSIPGAALGPGITHGVNSLYVGLQARIQDGVLYITGRLERSGGIPANHVLFTLPPGFRSPVPDPSYVYSGGDNFAVMQPNGECILALAATSYATITKMVIPLRN